MSAAEPTNSVSQLCPNCGLCCNGVLFADVELRRGDNAKQLAQLGLQVEKKDHGKLAFPQPCACFDGTLCKIYDDRPKRCRTFECGLLKRVQAGALDAGVALRKISKAKRRVEKVRERLRQLGQKEEQLALVKRYTEVMSAPIDLAKEEADSDRRGELMLAYDEFMKQLQRDFLK
jgi:Fe-S-cluster containining protein